MLSGNSLNVRKQYRRGLSLLEYVGGMPTYRRDSSGLWFCDNKCSSGDKDYEVKAYIIVPANWPPDSKDAIEMVLTITEIMEIIETIAAPSPTSLAGDPILKSYAKMIEVADTQWNGAALYLKIHERQCQLESCFLGCWKRYNWQNNDYYHKCTSGKWISTSFNSDGSDAQDGFYSNSRAALEAIPDCERQFRPSYDPGR